MVTFVFANQGFSIQYTKRRYGQVLDRNPWFAKMGYLRLRISNVFVYITYNVKPFVLQLHSGQRSVYLMTKQNRLWLSQLLIIVISEILIVCVFTWNRCLLLS